MTLSKCSNHSVFWVSRGGIYFWPAESLRELNRVAFIGKAQGTLPRSTVHWVWGLVLKVPGKTHHSKIPQSHPVRTQKYQRTDSISLSCDFSHILFHSMAQGPTDWTACVCEHAHLLFCLSHTLLEGRRHRFTRTSGPCIISLIRFSDFSWDVLDQKPYLGVRYSFQVTYAFTSPTKGEEAQFGKKWNISTRFSRHLLPLIKQWIPPGYQSWCKTCGSAKFINPSWENKK